MQKVLEFLVGFAGGLFGWFVGVFAPTFPLIIIAVAFIIYDSWTAYELDKRVHKRYPDRKKRPAKYVSWKAWGMIPTMIESFAIILLMYAVQRWVFIDIYVPLPYIATGVICLVQLLSIAENKASCRRPGDRGYRLWQVLAKILIDKTERHFDTDLSELKEQIKGKQ
jgi:hypothetical protein